MHKHHYYESYADLERVSFANKTKWHNAKMNNKHIKALFVACSQYLWWLIEISQQYKDLKNTPKAKTTLLCLFLL